MKHFVDEDTQAGGARLAERIYELERRNRRLERRTMVGALALAAVVLMGQASASLFPDVLTAQSFRLVDADGNARGAWTVADDGSVHLSVLDARGGRAAALELRAEAPYLVVRDGGGAARPVAAQTAPTPAAGSGDEGSSDDKAKSGFPIRIEKPDEDDEDDEDDGFEWLD